MLEDDVFFAPGVSVANDLYPGDERVGPADAGPVVRRGAQIGVNTTILPYVTIGENVLVGAGSVVTRDLPAGCVAYGNPRQSGARLRTCRSSTNEWSMTAHQRAGTG